MHVNYIYALWVNNIFKKSSSKKEFNRPVTPNPFYQQELSKFIWKENSYNSGNERAGHVEASEDEEGDSDVVLRRASRALHVRLKHALDHAVAAEADEVVDERHEDGGVLINIYTVCIGDLDKLYLIWWFDLRLKPSFATAPAASKKYTSLRKWHRNNHLTYFTKV